MNQKQMISEFNKEYFEKFNPEFFKFSEDDIIESLKKIILSCQRNKSFTIKVEGFTVVEDYDEIRNILRSYEESIVKGPKGQNGRKENQYDYINLKDSDVKLLIVDYYIAIKDQQDRLKVYIMVPRIVDKFYFHIGGNDYSAMHQIVDASTYNNSNTNSKIQSVTLKTMFMPIRIYKINETLKTTKKEQIKTVLYEAGMFSRTISVFKYFLAHFGWYNTMAFFNLDSTIVKITDHDIKNDDFYTFNKNNIYVNVSKFMFIDPIVQSFVCNVIKSVDKNTTKEKLYTRDFWIASLGSEFSSNAYEKGLNILDSLESNYDQITHETIHLPEEYKSDIYRILRWMVTEFSILRNKDNFNISTKKLRKADYIASIYSMKLAKGIYRISDLGKKADIKTIRKAIFTKPNYLINRLIKGCSLVSYRNMVSDLDAFTALKYTYKGIAGIGENKKNSVPVMYRYIYPEHLGRVDLDASSASDPGISGSLCPLADIYDGSFSEFEEPHYWDAEFMSLVAEYKKRRGLKEAIIFKESVLGIHIDQYEKDIIDDSLDVAKKLISPIIIMDQNSEENSYDLTADGNITLDLIDTEGDDNNVE